MGPLLFSKVKATKRTYDHKQHDSKDLCCYKFLHGPNGSWFAVGAKTNGRRKKHFNNDRRYKRESGPT